MLRIIFLSLLFFVLILVGVPGFYGTQEYLQGVLTALLLTGGAGFGGWGIGRRRED